MAQITPIAPAINTIKVKTQGVRQSDISKVSTVATEGTGETIEAQTPTGNSELQTVAPSDATPTTEEPNLTLVELSRRTKAQRQAQIKLQQDQQSLEQQKQEFAKKDSEYQSNYIPKDRLKTDLLGVLAELGYDQKMLSEAINTQPVQVDMEIKRLNQKILQLEAANNQTSDTFKQTQKDQYESALNRIRIDVKQLVKNDPNFDTIKVLEQEESVVEFIKDTFENGYTDKEGTEYPKGYVFNVSDASQLIEERLVEESLRRASLTKVKQKLAPPEPTKKDEQTHNKKPLKTLTNTMDASGAKRLSTNERIQRAIAVASGQLPPT